MRFHGLDLNLLTALDVILAESNITRAAKKLNMSQSATSSALARLREYFDDDLLVAMGRRMVRTARGEVLQREVRELLSRIELRVLSKPSLDLAQLERRISIMAADGISILILSKLALAVARSAPRLDIDIRVADDYPQLQIARGFVDLLVIPEVYAAPDHPREPLFTETFCAVVWRDSRAYAKRLTAKQYFAADHVSVDVGTQRKPTFDRQMLLRQGHKLRSSITVPSQALAPWYVVGSDRIATVPLSLARHFAAILPLRVLALPVPLPSMEVVVQWRREATGDEALGWLRNQMKTIASAKLTHRPRG
jgi:LysR family transcriptional regulator, nod-box dependent transcriptional activator